MSDPNAAADGSLQLEAELPAGTHPMDPSEPIEAGFGQSLSAPPDTPGNRYTTGAPPWNRDNDEAVPVFERASHDWTVQLIVVNSATNGGTAIAIGRQKGRKAVTLSVPTLLASGAAPLGVLYGPNEDSVQTGLNAAGILNVGDSVTISTEAAVYVGVIGANATGAVQVLAEFNAPGGGLGS